ncbi:hypothetical protein ACQX5I_09160 [Corynebacterium diphtheriae]
MSLAVAAAELGGSTVLHDISGKKNSALVMRTRMIEAKAQAEAASDAERIRVLEKENAKLREQRDNCV